jgi:hypothetical protein
MHQQLMDPDGDEVKYRTKENNKIVGLACATYVGFANGSFMVWWGGIGYMDHTGCHQLVFVTIRPTRVVTPGCQIGYMDYTGCHQLVIFTRRPTRV